jgi:hypothetical protein
LAASAARIPVLSTTKRPGIGRVQLSSPAYEPIMLEVLQPLDDVQFIEFAYYLAHLQ